MAARKKAAPASTRSKRPQARASASASEATAARLPRDPRGRRAQFYGDPGIDQLFAIVTALTAEVSVAFDRIDTLERLLERAGTLEHSDVEAFLPDADAAAQRLRKREELIQRVFQVLSQYPARG